MDASAKQKKLKQEASAEEPQKEEEVEDEEQNYFVDPNSEVLAPIQAQIQVQLTQENEELDLEIKEKEEEIKNISSKRQVIGVDLYENQRELATLQQNYQYFCDKEKEIAEISTEIQKNVQNNKELKQNSDTEFQNITDKYLKTRKEFEKIVQIFKQAQEYNTEIKSEINVKKRQTYKTKNVSEEIEKNKRAQDLLIDKLQGEIRTIHDELAIIGAQWQKQRLETRHAAETLAEAGAELEAIVFEKKQLSQQWKSSIIGLERRDEALKTTQEGIRKQIEQIKSIENEIENYQKRARLEKEEHQKKTVQLIQQENEKKYLEKRVAEIQGQIEQNQSVFLEFQKTLENTENESRRLDIDIKRIGKDIEIFDKQIADFYNLIQKKEEEQFTVLNDKKAFRKGEESTIQEIQRINNVIREKDIENAQVDNELARINIDELQTESRNDRLNEVLTGLEEEMKHKDTLIEKYEVEVSKKQDEIEKKQSSLDKLNRTYEKLKANQVDENNGPLEAEKNNLSKQIEALVKENERIKKEWTIRQSELVNNAAKIEGMSDEIKEKDKKIHILRQKKNRIERLSENEKAELDQLEKDIDQMHKEMKRINKLVSQNHQIKDHLEELTFDLENQIKEKLRTRQKEIITIENSISEIKEEKNRTLGDLVTVEQQIMYWQKKIQIQKEIQETIDPEVGQEEINKLKLEIHQMEQTLEKLKRMQKQKITDMQKAVSKRSIIVTKGKAAIKKSSNKAETKIALLREFTHLQSIEKQKRKEAREKANEIRKVQQEAEEMAKQISEIAIELESNEEKLSFMVQEIESLNFQKEKILLTREREDRLKAKIDSLRKYYEERKKLDENRQKENLSQEKYEETLKKVKPKWMKDEDKIDGCYENEIEKRNKIREVVGVMAEMFSQRKEFREILQELS